MDPKLLIRRYECFVYILIRMVNEYSQWEIGQLTECQDKYLMNRILILARSAYKIALLGVDNQLNNDVLNKLDSVIYSNRKLYVALENMPIHEIIRLPIKPDNFFIYNTSKKLISCNKRSEINFRSYSQQKVAYMHLRAVLT